jgi:hypothetical protein
MALNPSPQRQSVVTFPSPNVNDILFFETVDAERVGTDIPEYGSKHPDSKKWPNHRLVHVETADDQTRYYRYYYAADQLDQDDDNWAFSEADIGGTKFDAITREYVIRRSEFSSTTPAMGSAMPDVPAGKFTGTHVLAQRKQIPINDKILNGLYVIEQRVYVKKVPLYRLDYDEFFSKTNYTKQTLYYKGEAVGGSTIEVLAIDPDNTYWQLGTNGILRTLQQLSDNWYAVTEQQVVNTDSGGGSFSYDTSVNYSFPPVLQDIDFDLWERRSGAKTYSPRVKYSKGAYRGPCKAVVAVVWSATKPTATTVPSPPQPEPIAVSTPYFSLSVKETLHDVVNVSVSNGTEDEKYVYTAGTYTFQATNLIDWPSSLVVSSTVKKFRGGWLKETVTVYAPTVN